MKCPHCGGLVVLSDRGEYVCHQCGTVLDVEYVWGRRDYLDPSSSYISIGEVVRRSHRMDSTDLVNKANRLLKTKRLIANSHGGDEGFECVIELCRMLGVDCRIVLENYALLLGKLYERGGLSKCKTAVATFIYSIFTGAISLRLNDVLKAYEKMGKRLSLSDLATIMSLLRVRQSLSDKVKSSITSLVEKLNCGSKTAVVKSALEKYARLPKRVVAGKNPYTLAAALVYLSAVENNCGVELKGLAEHVGVSKVTLKEYIQKVQAYCR